jgi:secreted PhoX family phosphatase
MFRKLTLAATAALVATAAVPALAQDFGLTVQQMLANQSEALFGIVAPLGASAQPTEGAYRTPGDNAGDTVALAQGLTADFTTRELGNHGDMMAFYPAENPTHLISCVEGDREEIAAGKYNPGVQRISLTDGTVETIVRGSSRCDGIRTTPWGTILFTEEEDDGTAYEILDPLHTTDVTITNRATGETTDPEHVIVRHALPIMAWEGIGVTAEGVVYGGDELRPGTADADVDGGGMFKFVPANPHTGGMITSLDASPLADGTTYAMQVSCRDDRPQFGQGCEVGNAVWVEVNAATARPDADAVGATGYYRPEDGDIDPVFTGEGVRFCWNNTGNEGGDNFAEVMCLVDSTPLVVADADGAPALTTSVNRFWEGDTDANSFDNMAFQPGTGILYVIEDHPNGDIWACLPDGDDRDIKTDGCIKVLSVMDSSAEPTGFIFAPDGLTAYVTVQHSNDDNMANVDDYPTDDLVVITGFRAPAM